MRALLLLSCSAAKSHIPDIPSRLYKGVMWQSFAKHSGGYMPELIVLSAEYGLIDNRIIRAPYDRKMDDRRAAEMLADIERFDSAAWDCGGVTHILLAGGEAYKRVMRSAIERRIAWGVLDPSVTVEEVSGGIGEQRSQLGAWLRRMADLRAAALNAEPVPWWLDLEVGCEKHGEIQIPVGIDNHTHGQDNEPLKQDVTPRSKTSYGTDNPRKGLETQRFCGSISRLARWRDGLPGDGYALWRRGSNRRAIRNRVAKGGAFVRFGEDCIRIRGPPGRLSRLGGLAARW